MPMDVNYAVSSSGDDVVKSVSVAVMLVVVDSASRVVDSASRVKVEET